MTHGRLKSALAITCAAFGLVTAQPAFAQQRNFNVPAQDARKSIPEFARQAGLQISAPTGRLKGVRTKAIKGNLDARAALRALIEGTGLSIMSDDGSMIILRHSPASSSIQPSETPASAQRVSSLADDGNADQDVDIIVTAQKREELLREVPVPVTVLSAASLTQNNQLRIQDYYTRVPGLNFSTGYRGDPYVVIRGVTTTGAANPTVGFVIDDVPFGSSSFIGGGASAPDLDPSDLERIEVLRGPQGALYGASSIGGLLKFVTRDPSTDRFAGRITAGLTMVEESRDLGFVIRGSVNVPLGDALAVRASGFLRRDPGYIDDPLNQIRDTNRRDVGGGRAALLWEPSADVSIKLSALLQRQDADGAFFSDPVLGDLERAAVRGTGGYSKDIESYAATIRVALGAADVTSITSYGRNEVIASNDLSLFYSGQANSNFGVTGVEFVENNVTKKFTQEVRASLPITRHADWRVGGFYTNERTEYEQSYFAEDPLLGIPVGTLLFTSFPSTFKEYAVFSDLIVRLGERFDIQFGGRYSKNDQSYSQVEIGPLVPGQVVQARIDSSDDSFTYLVVPRFRVSRDLMVYARFASGYRPGGPNLGARRYGLPLTVKADTTQNYEVGIKGSLMGNALTYDLSAYRIDWEDVQISFRDPVTAFSFLTNAGRARIQGVEASIEARPWRGASLAVAASYNDAELAEDLPVSSSVRGVKGDPLPYSPRFSGSVTADQEFPLSDLTSLTVGATISHVGNRKGVFRGVALRQTFPEYTNVDFRLGIEHLTWQASLFLNNVFDERGVLAGGLGNIHPTLFNYIQPRTLGLSITKSF